MGMKRFRLFGITIALLGICVVCKKGYIGGKVLAEEALVDNLELLKSLPYIDYSAEPVQADYKGVVYIDKEAVFNGYNMYYDMLKETTFLLDMEGGVIKSWPNFNVYIISEDGSLIGTRGKKISKLSWDGTIIWQKNIMQHHEISLSSFNTIYFLTKETHPYKGKKVDFDTVVELSQEGKELYRWSSYENLDYLKKSYGCSDNERTELNIKLDLYYKANRSKFGADYDYYHINSVYSLPETALSRIDNRFKRDNLLISLSLFDLIIILDKKTNEVVWSWGPGDLRFQHSPRILNNGNILIFDNLGNHGFSRVIEINPTSKKITWEYKGNPPESFYTAGGGFAQRLDNGNTLVTECNRGHVFEINHDGKIVWDWFSKDFSKDLTRRQVLARMYRYPKVFIDNILRRSKKGIE